MPIPLGATSQFIFQALIAVDDVKNEIDLERFLTDAVTPHLPVSGVAMVVLDFLSPLLPPVTYDKLNDSQKRQVKTWYWQLTIYVRTPVPSLTDFIYVNEHEHVYERLEDWLGADDEKSRPDTWREIARDPRWLLFLHGYLPIPPVPSLEPFCDDPAHVSVIEEKSDGEEICQPDDSNVKV